MLLFIIYSTFNSKTFDVASSLRVFN